MNVKADLTKAVFVAGAGVLGSILMGEKDTKIPLAGMNLPAPLLLGVATGTSSVVADMAHDYVLPHIPHNDKWVNMESSALAVSTAGASTSAILYFGTGMPRENLFNSFALGGGAVIAGDYAHSKTYGLHGESLF
jgi:hypothetical protein